MGTPSKNSVNLEKRTLGEKKVLEILFKKKDDVMDGMAEVACMVLKMEFLGGIK